MAELVLHPCGLCLSLHLTYGLAKVFPNAPGRCLLAFKAGLSWRRNGGAWRCQVDGEVPSALRTTMEMPVAPMGSTFPTWPWNKDKVFYSCVVAWEMEGDARPSQGWEQIFIRF